MATSWPFGSFPCSKASPQVLRIAELDLSRYGHAESLQVEFKRYLLLRLLWNRRITMQSDAVDHVWHSFILDTPRYRLFCQEVFGEYLDHTSSHFELDPGFARGYQGTFGEKMPDVWLPTPAQFDNCA